MNYKAMMLEVQQHLNDLDIDIELVKFIPETNNNYAMSYFIIDGRRLGLIFNSDDNNVRLMKYNGVDEDGDPSYKYIGSSAAAAPFANPQAIANYIEVVLANV